LPELKGKLDGIAIRVPTPDVSLIDLTVRTVKPVTLESANQALQDAANGPMKGVLQYVDDELVSVDFLHNPHSSIVDAPLTKTIGDRLIKVFSWYDNEWGFSCRMCDLIKLAMKSSEVSASEPSIATELVPQLAQVFSATRKSAIVMLARAARAVNEARSW